MTVDIGKQNEILVEQFLAGDTTARNKLIKINRRLVFTTVKRVLDAWPDFQRLRDDLIGEGMLALVRAIDRLAEIGEASRPIRNYLITAIRSKLLTELMEQTEHYRFHRYVKTYDNVPEYVLAANDPIFNQIDDREFLLSLCDSERERKILTLFLEGRKFVDIIRNTGYTKNVVQKTLDNFREKLQIAQDSMSELGSN